MYRCFVFIVVVFVPLFNPFASADENSEQVDQLFAKWDREDSPGAVVAVVRDGKTLYSNGYGQANLEHGVPNTPSTIFHVASVSKQFTAFAIFLLEEDGKLSLDDDVRKHLPELHEFNDTIELRHLIHHTSGLRDQWELLVLAGWRMDDVITHSDVLELAKTQTELNFPPGEKYLYCNMGYTLLAEIVKRVSGKSLKEFCHERIFVPLEMDNTHFHDDHRQIVPNRSDCYWPMRRGWQKAVLSYAVVGATSLLTTAEDLAKWQRNFEVQTIGNEATHKQLETRAVLNNGEEINYAGGVYHGSVSGNPTLGHSGGDAGYVCHVERFTEKNLSVIVLANTSNVPTAQLAHQVGMLYLKENDEKNEGDTSFQSVPEIPMRESNPLAGVGQPTEMSGDNDAAVETDTSDDLNLGEYAGRYYCPELDVSYDLLHHEDRLFLRRRKYGTQRFRKTGDDVFRVSSGLSMQVRFERDAESDQVSALRISTGRVKNLKFVKQD